MTNKPPEATQERLDAQASQHFSLAELFPRGDVPHPGSYAMQLSTEAREVLTRIGGGNPEAEMIVLLAALALLLHRYGAPTPLLFEVPSSRDHGQDVRADPIQLLFAVDENITARDWLLQVRQIAVSGLSAGIASTTAAGALLLWDRRLHRSPPALLGLKIGLEFGLDEGAAYTLHDPAGLVPPGLINGFAAHLGAIVRGMEALDAPLTHIAMMGTQETIELAQLGHGGPPASGAETLVSRFWRFVEVTPEAPAIIADDQVVSYSGLSCDALLLSYRLIDAVKVQPGEAVAIAATRSWHTVLAFLGVLYAGAVAVPFDPKAPRSHIDALLSAADARALLVAPDEITLAFDFPHLPVLCPALEKAGWRTPETWSPISRTSNDLAAIFFTSGSEGRPKGVVLEHGGLANTVADHVDRLGISAGDRYLQFMAPFFDGGLLDMLTPLSGGAALVTISDATLRDIETFHDYLQRHGVTALTATPSYISLIDIDRLPSLRLLVSAAEPARARDFRRLAGRIILFNGYGPTETSVNATLYRAPRTFSAADVPIGRASAGKRIAIVDPQGRLRPRGVVGEIVISGSGVARSYLADAVSTERMFSNDGSDGQRCYRSGDLGAWDADGQLRFLGRRDQQIKVRGYRIEQGHIESVMLEHPAVREASVVFDASTRGLLGFYVANPSQEPAPSIDSFLRGRLPEYMVPAEIFPIEVFPRTPTGKIDAGTLLQLASAVRAARPSFRVATPTETALVTIWRETLRIDHVDSDADFFRLGGDSIRIIEAVHTARLRGFEVTAADLLEHRTLGALARFLDGKGRNSDRKPAPAISTDLDLTAAELAQVPVGWEDAFPVSSMQELMLRWYEEPLLAANGVYHCLARWSIRHNLFQEAALDRALHALVARHGSLRTAFVRVAATGRLLQRALAPETFVIRRTDLRAVEPTAQAVTIAAITSAEGAERFQINDVNRPVARFHLILRSESEFDLLFVAHHAVLDGWSGVTLQNELVDFYWSALRGDLGIEAPPPGPSYREFVAVDREAARSEAAAAFWVSRCCELGELKSLAEPPSSARPLFMTRETGLSATMSRALADTAVESGLSIKAMCLAAYLRAAGRLLGATPVVGMITNGRSEQLTDPLGATGLFWNIVPFVTPVDQPTTPVVQAELDAIAAFQAYPFAAILRDSGRSRLFDVCFNFISFHHARSGFGGLEEQSFQALDRFHFGATLVVYHEEAEGVPKTELRLEYRRDYLDDEAAARMIQEFIGALRSEVLATTNLQVDAAFPQGILTRAATTPHRVGLDQ